MAQKYKVWSGWLFLSSTPGPDAYFSIVNIPNIKLV